MNIKKGDNVKILNGKDNGKTGRVISVEIKRGRVLVEGVNLYKKHVRPKRAGEKGQVVQLPRPLNVSNIAIVCQGCHKATRIGHRIEGEKKVRFCKKCKTTI